jgi:hypothetical protein
MSSNGLEVIEMIETIRDKVIEIIKDEFNWDDEAHYWTSEIYVDTNDYDAFLEFTMNDIVKSDKPKDKFYDLLSEAYMESEVYEVDYVYDTVSKRLDQEEIEYDACELREFIQDHSCIEFPYDYFLNLEIPVNVIIDAGDANYDFGCNDSYGYENVDALSGIAYLVKKQGYSLTDLRKAIVSREPSESKFINSVVNEWRHASGGCNATTIFTTMTVNDWFYFHELKQWEKPINNPYYPWKGKGRSYITVDGTADWGLVNYWHGGGSILGGFLEKDMRIPIRYVWDIIPEVGQSNPYGYSVREIYGCYTDWYTGKVTVHRVNNKLL